MKKLTGIFCITILLMGFSHASATTFTAESWYGDADGFGIGVNSGESFDWSAIVREADDDPSTDQWIYGSLNWVHSFDISGFDTLTSASLDIMAGGLGFGGLGSLYIHDTFFVYLKDGDDVGPGYNYAWEESFDLSPFLATLTGVDSFRVATYGEGDGWALDYSHLSVTGEAAGSCAAPEPATMLLMGTGLIGLAAGCRKKILGRD
jgi:hypothetical protein